MREATPASLGQRRRSVAGACVCMWACARARPARLTLPEIIHFAEDLLVLDVAAAVLT